MPHILSLYVSYNLYEGNIFCHVLSPLNNQLIISSVTLNSARLEFESVFQALTSGSEIEPVNDLDSEGHRKK